MTLLHAIALGIVEGLTEFLPVSSTAHLILASRVLGLSTTEYLKSFEIAIQFGAIAAVAALYGRTLFSNFEIQKRVLAAFLPTAVVGLLLYKAIKKYLFVSTALPAWMLLLGGVFLVLFEKFRRKETVVESDLARLSYSKAFCVGLFQALAMVPGVSRSAATIIGGLLLGVPRKTIVEFSFLLAVPTILAAAALDLLKSGAAFNATEWTLLLAGAAAAFVTALVIIRFFIRFIQNHTFIPFGIYRIAAGVAFLILLNF